MSKMEKYNINTGMQAGLLVGEIAFDKKKPSWGCLRFKHISTGGSDTTIPFFTVDRHIEVLTELKKSKEYKAWEKWRNTQVKEA
jgi:hypothetical protein